MEERVAMSGETGGSSGDFKSWLDAGDTVASHWGVCGVEGREGNSVLVATSEALALLLGEGATPVLERTMSAAVSLALA